MGKYIVNGGRKLYGDVIISGSKNSAPAILFSCLIVNGTTVLCGLPKISDVDIAVEILKYYGSKLEFIDRETLKIDTACVSARPIPTELCKKMRASSYLLGGLISRFGECDFVQSGGCDFGFRPLNLHVDALKNIGAEFNDNVLFAKKGLRGGNVIFPIKTVGGTVNAIIAAAKAKGVTVIKNAATEPHVKDLARFLNCCGARIYGAGSNTVKVVGVKELKGCTYKIDTDMIETGTYALASLATNGKVRCINAPINEMTAFSSVLKQMGAEIEIENGSYLAYADTLRATNVTSAPYPYFPTDLQPQITAILGLAKGSCFVTEGVFENRFAYVNELKKCGFIGKVNGNTITVSGTERYSPAFMRATDLRGGAALTIAALNAHGTSQILNTELIERGYSDFVEKLQKLGADIKKS